MSPARAGDIAVRVSVTVAMVRSRRSAGPAALKGKLISLEGEVDQRQRDRADDDRGHEIGHGRRLFGGKARKLASPEAVAEAAARLRTSEPELLQDAHQDPCG
jgi:hypothetical protein